MVSFADGDTEVIKRCLLLDESNYTGAVLKGKDLENVMGCKEWKLTDVTGCPPGE